MKDISLLVQRIRMAPSHSRSHGGYEKFGSSAFWQNAEGKFGQPARDMCFRELGFYLPDGLYGDNT